MADLYEKLKGAKKKIIQGANGVMNSEAMNSEGSKEAKEMVSEYGAGLKGMLLKKGSSFLKTYVNEKMTTDNPTGATVGACGEYIVKQVGKEVMKGIVLLQQYLEKEANRYEKLEAIPELEVVKSILEGYAQDSQEQGREQVKYKGVEFIVDKTEKELSVNLKNKEKEVTVTYFLNGVSIPTLSKELYKLTDDLLKRLNKLINPSIASLEKTTNLIIDRDGKEILYHIQFKKTEETLEIGYSPEKKGSAIMLKYSDKIKVKKPEIQEEKKNETRRKTSGLRKNTRRTNSKPRKHSQGSE